MNMIWRVGGTTKICHGLPWIGFYFIHAGCGYIVLQARCSYTIDCQGCGLDKNSWRGESGLEAVVNLQRK